MRFTTLALCFCLALVAPASTREPSDFHDFYVLGLQAVDYELWADGVILFSKAIEEQPAAGGLVRPYGTWTESYVPHYYLGLCLFELGRYPRALGAWEMFASQPPSEYPRNRRKKERVAELRGRLSDLLPGRLDALREELELALRWVRELEEASVRGFRGEGDSESPAAIVAVVTEALDVLSEAQGGDAIETLRNLGAALETANEWVDGEERALAKMRQDEAIASELDERNRIAALFANADAEVGGGRCAPAAIDDLAEVLHRSFDSAVVGREPSEVAVLLGRAHHACGAADRAARYLSLATRWGDPSDQPDPAVLALRDEIGAAAAPVPTELEIGLSAYARALAWISSEVCSEAALDALDEAQGRLARIPESEVRINDILFQPDLSRARGEWNCRNRSAALQSLKAARKRGAASPQEIDTLERRIEAAPIAALYEGSYALLVVAHDYLHDEPGWKDLPGARTDIDALRSAFASHGFAVETMENPMADELEKRLRKFTSEHGRNPANRLVVYYAGHGWTEEAYGVKNGYIVPTDTPFPPGDAESFQFLISMGVFELNARPMLARHALFIFDTCFGGLVFEQSKHSHPDAGSMTATPELLENPVRMFLSAGDDGEPVPDFSVFRRVLIRGMAGGADVDGDGIVLGRELGPYIREAVTRTSHTTPQWGVLKVGNLGDGDIAFERLASAPDRTGRELDIEIDFWETVLGSKEVHSYEHYLDAYPLGAFAALARGAIDRLRPVGR